MKTNIVLCDVDGTLNDIQNYFIHYVELMGFGYNFKHCNNYDLSSGIIAEKKKDIMNEIFNMDNFWLTAPAQRHSVEGLKYLNDNYELFIVTVPWSKHNELVKIEWMNKNYPFINTKQIVFSDDKWLLKGDVIVEDKPKTLKKCMEHGFISIKKLQPYNLTTNSNYDLHSWSEIESIMKSIELKGEIQ